MHLKSDTVGAWKKKKEKSVILKNFPDITEFSLL
jgi:hypothetical protein